MSQKPWPPQSEISHGKQVWPRALQAHQKAESDRSNRTPISSLCQETPMAEAQTSGTLRFHGYLPKEKDTKTTSPTSPQTKPKQITPKDAEAAAPSAKAACRKRLQTKEATTRGPQYPGERP